MQPVPRSRTLPFNPKRSATMSELSNRPSTPQQSRASPATHKAAADLTRSTAPATPGPASARRAGAMFGDTLKSKEDSLENQGVLNAGEPQQTAEATMPQPKRKRKKRDRRNELPRLCMALSAMAMERLQGRAKRLHVTPQALIRTLLATGAQADVPPAFSFPSLERAALAAERMEARLNYLTAELLRHINQGDDVANVIIALQGLQPEVRRLRMALDERGPHG